MHKDRKRKRKRKRKREHRHYTSIMSLSSNLWSATGLFHCLVGFAVPELRDPLLHILREGSVTVHDKLTIEERYAREAAVWFQFFGVMVVLQGLAWKQYVHETTTPTATTTTTNKHTRELPSWWGWSVTALGIAFGKLMPQSGWPLILLQGVRIVWRNRNQNKKLQGKEE